MSMQNRWRPIEYAIPTRKRRNGFNAPNYFLCDPIIICLYNKIQYSGQWRNNLYAYPDTHNLHFETKGGFHHL